MLLKEVLAAKGRAVYSITPSASIMDVVRKMVEHNCGSLLVCEDEQLVGIISERDILRAIAATDVRLEQLTVDSRMTRNVVTGSPTDSINDTIGVMSKHRIRHLPVLENGKLYGMISIGDLVNAQHQLLMFENHQLMTYIQG